MPIFETYTKRFLKLSKAGQQDVFRYDIFPSALRVQVSQIFDDAIGRYYEGGYAARSSSANLTWETMCNTMKREKGMFSLSGKNDDPRAQVHHLILNGTVDDFLDILDLGCAVIKKYVSTINVHNLEDHGIKQNHNDAINEINYRLREHGLGYECIEGQIIRIDSKFLHSEAVIPALVLLADKDFEGANDEFRSAYNHYKAKEYKDSIVDANSAFESVLKTICDIRSWEYPRNSTGSNVLSIVKSKGLFPDYLDNSFDQLLSVLKSGLPKIRNEEGGHGQGRKIKQTPAHVASFALHLAASKMLFLLECHKDYKE